MIESQPDEILEVLDIIFKWVNFRLASSSNSALIIASFELFEKMMNFFGEKEYVLEDFEAIVLIGTLCEKTGSGNRGF